ncbi:dihydroorotate dehydrogenase, putative [Perkinsus marinus ATCC 50983]|uniref:Dihydroorotate dehydrogenase (quinone), mitochondrial n=1 Tax=Perkinsus marinus (strain ATCC 50983 / TXsc) TaxID=423536 RepID=C5K5A0_PERM5|nr:dihydroorotate dehydrogenase, putative [Perkinsus marinus ATCC 50983]EER20522.1 dihydroorotate dehydrogenase, putative [Perkinsus marinus ATCC 50983]|eukprot:XP_002788726.1 dihydroorotate dehydrogenase, putative [Perkinsus marinus ATCC 50983]
MPFTAVRRLRNTVGIAALSGAAAYYVLATREARVLLGLHGGVDTTPAAAVCWGTRLYRGLVVPILFPLTASDPEVAHRMAIMGGAVYGRIVFFFHRFWNCLNVYNERVMDRIATILLDGDSRRPACAVVSDDVDPLKQVLFGVEFPRPVGLAAGFDKNGELLHLLTSSTLGNGFAEIGSVSKEPWPGNPRPRMFRLARDGAVINRMGLNNRGAAALREKLRSMSTLLNGTRHTPPIGVSITKTPSPTIENDAAIADIVASFDEVAPYAAYIDVNISCPNTAEGKTFEDLEALEKLLGALLTWRRDNYPDKPVLVKLSPPPAEADDTYYEGVSRMVRKAVELGVDGFVMINTIADRGDDLNLDRSVGDSNHGEKGGISGKPVRQRAINLVRHVYKVTAGKVPIIGCGGVFTAQDAYRLIRNGASLIQVYTGMIYEGPWVFRDINCGLAELLRKDGYSNVHEAVGVDVKSEFY